MSILKSCWRLTNRVTKWWGITLVCLLFILAVVLMTGTLTLDVNLDLVIIDDLRNPMIALLLFALALLIVFYAVFFILALPIVFVLSLRKKKANETN